MTTSFFDIYMTLFWYLLLMTFPCVCCVGATFSLEKFSSTTLRYVIRSISVLGFFVSWFYTFFIYSHSVSNMDVDISPIYDAAASYILPIAILASILIISVVRNQQGYSYFRNILIVFLFALTINWQFLALVQIDLIPSSQTQNTPGALSTVSYYLLPTVVLNVSLLAIAVFVNGKFLRRR